MQAWHEESIGRRDGVTIPRIWIAVAVSIAVHTALLWSWRYEVRFPSEGSDLHQGPLVVRIVPPPSPPAVARQPPASEPPAPTPQAKAARPRAEAKASKPKPTAPRKPTPDVLARADPAPGTPAVPPSSPVVPPAPPATSRAPEGDLASLVESRRRAREQAAAASAPASPPAAEAAEDANARANRLAAANLGSNRRPSFGSDPRKGGGVFSIQRMAYDSAEFTFFGWNKDIQRNTLQLIEVRKGAEPDIRIAVVRKMIAIIREQEKEDFIWESKRLGHNVVLSARPRDTRGLEDFLMREFF